MVAQRDRGEVDIVIDGVTRTLRLSRRAQRELANELGVEPGLKGLQSVLTSMDEERVFAFVRHALQGEQPEDWDEVYMPIAPAAEAVADCLMLAYFGPEGPPQDDPPKAQENP